MKNKNLKKSMEKVQISARYTFAILIACFALQAMVNAQSVMRADTERISNVGPLKAKMISSSIISGHRFHNPFLLRNVNPAGDQFGFDQSLNTLSFYIDRMGNTNSRDQILYVIVNNASVDHVKAIRQTSQYDETYFVRSPEVIPMPEHWHFDPLGDWLPFPINSFLQKHAPAYNLGVSDWSGGVGIEIKFSNEIKKDLLLTIVAVNPNRSKRDIERLMKVPFSTMLNMVKYLGESSYSDYVSFVNYHLEYNAAQGGACNNLLLTSSTYSETSNLNASVSRELGSGHSIADWNDLKAIRDIDAWISCMGLQPGESFMVTFNGNARVNNGDRQFFIRYSPGGVPDNFLVHEQIGSKLFLGSWHGLNLKILGKKRR